MAARYVPYFPNTLEGQAILDNFVRTKRVLRYRDNDKVVERIERGMPLYEMELKEQIGKNPNQNMVIRGECLSACAYLKDKGVQVDLVYIDPPFASGADYAKKVYIRRNPRIAIAIRDEERRINGIEDEWHDVAAEEYLGNTIQETQNGEEVISEELRAFEEKMYGDIWDKERYLNWMYENLMAIKSIMSDDASIYVHLDYHIGHYVKILLDEVFGEDCYRSEIIWKRSSAHSDSNTFANIHDTIFFYQLGKAAFNTTYIPYSNEYTKQYYSKRDSRGLFKDSDLTAIGKKGGGYEYVWKGKKNVWICPITSMQELDEKGLLYYTKNGTPRLKQYLTDMPGVPAQDIWTDIFPVNSQAEERVDYATQKPIELLERIIKASSNENMLVADFFGGSGVTAKAAYKLGRRFIHCDIGINSIQTARDRLLADKAEFEVLEVKDGVSLYRNPVQTMDKLKSLIKGLRNEDALDKFWDGSIVDTKYGMMPVYLPNLMDSSTRLLDIPLMNRIIREALPDLPEDTQRVVVYYIDITDRQEIEEFIKEQNDQTTIDIELRDLKQVLDDVVVEDKAEWELGETHDALWTGWKVELKGFHSDRVLRKINEVNLKGQQQSLQQKAKGKNKEFKPIIISDEGLETIEWVSLDCTIADKQAAWHSDAEVRIDRLGYVVRNGQKTRDFWDATIECENKPLRMKIRNICGDETIFIL